jgi:uncharacterized membrane protein YccC
MKQKKYVTVLTVSYGLMKLFWQILIVLMELLKLLKNSGQELFIYLLLALETSEMKRFLIVQEIGFLA